MSKLLLVGAGGHCRSVLDSIDRSMFAAIAIVDVVEQVGQYLDDVPIIGTDEDLSDLYALGYDQAFISFGSIGNTEKREALFLLLKQIGFTLPCIIDSSAIIAKKVSTSEGTFIGKGAIINAGTQIGICCIVNTGAVIDHDCSIGDFTHVATGASLSGGVKVGQKVHIGTGSSIVQAVQIADNALVGAGSVVVSHLEKNVVAFGNPCKINRKKEVK